MWILLIRSFRTRKMMSLLRRLLMRVFKIEEVEKGHERDTFLESMARHKFDNPVWNSSTDETASRCGWQIGKDRFAGPSQTDVTKLESTGRDYLGHGVVGSVEEVKVSRVDKWSFVRKGMWIPRSPYQAKERLANVESEVEALRKLQHPHIVKASGSYHQGPGIYRHIYFLLLWPVGDADMDVFRSCLRTKSPSRPQERRLLSWSRLRRNAHSAVRI